jgi:hypothetical protein
LHKHPKAQKEGEALDDETMWKKVNNTIDELNSITGKK